MQQNHNNVFLIKKIESKIDNKYDKTIEKQLE